MREGANSYAEVLGRQDSGGHFPLRGPGWQVWLQHLFPGPGRLGRGNVVAQRGSLKESPLFLLISLPSCSHFSQESSCDFPEQGQARAPGSHLPLHFSGPLVQGGIHFDSVC